MEKPILFPKPELQFYYLWNIGLRKLLLWETESKSRPFSM